MGYWGEMRKWERGGGGGGGAREERVGAGANIPPAHYSKFANAKIEKPLIS